jgi:type I restriction-modification system DNA methylase subunit
MCYSVVMTFKDTDELRAFLRTIKTYEQFWDAKEPTFSDVMAKRYFDWSIAQGDDPAEILIALKTCEVQQFSEEFEARQQDRLH